jgi:drug/metabolite transporter (DMT)-like permease
VIALASLLFSVMTIAVRTVAHEIPPIQVAFWRFAGSTVVLLLAGGTAAARPQGASARVLIVRGLLGAAAISCWFTGIRDVGAAIATLLHSTYPLWATLISVVVFRERFGWQIGGALLLNLTGIALVVGPTGGGAPHALRGSAYSLMAGMLAGAAVATARRLRATENASVITLWFMGVGALVTAPSLLLGTPTWSPHVIAGLSLVALTSAGGQWLLHHGLGFTTAAQGSLAAATSIVSTALLEQWWFGSRLEGHTVIGAVLMVSAVALAMSKRD